MSGVEHGDMERGDMEHSNVELLARLGRIADEVDPVPGLAYELGRAAFEFGRVDAELVELSRDSAVDTELMAGVRGSSDARLLSFEAADVDIDLQVVPVAERRSVLGQVAGAVAAVRVQTATEGTITTAVDPHGRFRLDDTPAGHIRLHLDAADAQYVTSWVTI